MSSLLPCLNIQIGRTERVRAKRTKTLIFEGTFFPKTRFTFFACHHSKYRFASFPRTMKDFPN